MAWQIFDSAGQLFPCELNGRIIGVTLDELRAVPQTIAVAVGGDKARAIKGALASGAIDVLVTDEQTAVQVLESASTPLGPPDESGGSATQPPSAPRQCQGRSATMRRKG